MVTLSVRDSAKLELLLSPELFALKVLFNANGFTSFHSSFFLNFTGIFLHFTGFLYFIDIYTRERDGIIIQPLIYFLRVEFTCIVFEKP